MNKSELYNNVNKLYFKDHINRKLIAYKLNISLYTVNFIIEDILSYTSPIIATPLGYVELQGWEESPKTKELTLQKY